MTELVSRVLYTCVQPSSIFTADHSAVQAKSSATMKRSEQPRSVTATNQGVASDRVYSKPMLPQEWVSSYLAFPSLPRLLLIAQNKILLEFLGAIFSLDVGYYALRHKNLSFCTIISSRGTVLSTLYKTAVAVYFCCTFPGVASGGRYPLSCSVMPGLSSP